IVTLSVDDHEECHDVTHLDRASCRIVTVNTPAGMGQFTTYDFMELEESSCVLDSDMPCRFQRRRPKS
ncbi:hypothetical protein BDFB_009843, partial [Asbolus verrucosus]